MLTFIRLQERIGVTNKMALFEVINSIELLITPNSGLGFTLTLPGYSSRLMQFT